LTYWQKTRLVILPQALKVVIPPLVGQFITTFKDTSLVIIIGLYDLLSSTKVALSDPQWRAFYVEGYVAAALIYFVFSYVMSQYSQYLERRLSAGVRRR
jgi:general L-amino acid transport system permease protein